MEDYKPAESWRTQQCVSEPNRSERMHRRSIPGSHPLNLTAHHGFSTPKVVRAAHWPLQSDTPKEVWRHSKDSVALRGREVARNLFLDRWRDLSKSEMV